VLEHYKDQKWKVAVQNAVSGMFTRRFLAFKTLVLPNKSASADELTPGKSQAKIYLGKLAHLVVEPMTCEYLL
jgi:Trm5-related predicted tRNA methylase